MRRALCALIVLAAVPLSALDLVVYDNFRGRLINRSKWIGLEWGNWGAAEATREILGNKLRVMHRLYGRENIHGVPTTSGQVRAGNRMLMINAANVTSMQITAAVTKYELAACSGNPAPAIAALTLAGYFMNVDGLYPAPSPPAPQPGPGSHVLDLQLGIRIERSSASVNGAQVLDVGPSVRICANQDCSAGFPLPPSFPAVLPSLGTVNVGQQFTVGIDWSQVDYSVRFQLNDNAPLVSPPLYPLNPPGLDEKYIEVANTAPNCGSTRTTAFIDADIFEVRVNPAAF